MTALTIAELMAAGIRPTAARTFVEPLNAAFERFDISTRTRQAAFVAQANHESKGFAALEEDLWYRRPERIRQMWPMRVTSMSDAARLCGQPQALANRVYCNRLGNGDEASGDGWTYRGRGLFQLTGRANYEQAARAIGFDYVLQPELVAQPRDAALTAAWYWAEHALNALADSAQIDLITRRINGPSMVAADDRRSMFDEALRAFA